jgi:PAS domain S-box-containing protein
MTSRPSPPGDREARTSALRAMIRAAEAELRSVANDRADAAVDVPDPQASRQSFDAATPEVQRDDALGTEALKRAHEELLRSQALLRIAGHAAKLGGWRFDLDDERLVWSDETCAIHDRPPGHRPTLSEGVDYYLPEYRAMVSAALRRTLDTGEPFRFEAELVTAHGRRIWGRAIGEAVRNEAGDVVGLQGAFQDITTQRLAVTEVDRLARRLTTTLESLSDAFFTLDQEWRFSYVNAQAELLLHRPRQSLLGRNIWELFPEAVAEQFYPEYHRAVRERASVTFEAHHAPLRAWFEVWAYPSEDGLAVYFRDVTERRRQRDALRESEERFRLLAKATNDAIWDWDLTTDALWWNEGFETLFGFNRADIESTIESWTTRIHPDDHTHTVSAVHEAIDRGDTTWSGEYRFVRRDGSYVFVLDRGYVIRDESGRAVRMIGGMTDLTERRKTEERLREQATLLDKAQDAILVRDLDHHITYWNRSAERLYGWAADEAVGRSVVELLYRESGDFQAATEKTLEHGEWVGELQQQTKAGQPLTVEAHWTLVRDDAGRPKSILAINTDISERKRLETQVLRAQRMESIGTLAGGIAHDLNNVLTPIMMSVELLELLGPDDAAREILETIQTSARRGADMVSQVLGFARGMDGQRVTVDVGRLVADFVKIIRDTFPKDIRVEVAVAPDLWALAADPTQLHQVLLNLCVNARDAMPDGGTITIRAGNLSIDEHDATMNLEARVGPYVALDVTDSGVGIPPAIVDRIFEPFFTTKAVGKGTGLGLATTLAIVKSHGGFVQVHSAPGMGARFRICLPAAGPGGQAVVPVSELLPRGEGQTVLIVDDEASIRQIARQMLESFGYRVHVAANGEEALALVAHGTGDIAVALIDMMMPVMDGPATIRALERMAPSIRIIGTSGIAGNDKVAQALGAEFLPKPYTAEALLKALARSLGNPGWQT